MSLSLEHVLALREVGIHADTFDEAREQLAKKLKVWGYVDYSFQLERFFFIIQNGRIGLGNYSEKVSEGYYGNIDECQEELMSELIETAKQKHKHTNP